MRQTHNHRGFTFDTFLTDPPDDAGENHLFTWSADVELPNKQGTQTICTDAIGRGEAIDRAETAIDELINSWN
jgi:hypothetical protein